MALDAFLEEIQAQVVEVGQHIAPDGDWLPVLIIEPKNPKAPRVFVGLQADVSTEAGKDSLVNLVIPALVRKANGKRFAFISTAWQVKVRAETGDDVKAELSRIGGVSKHPNRQEIICIYVFDRDARKVAVAPITRSPAAPPALGKWDVFDNSAGRFSEMWKALDPS